MRAWAALLLLSGPMLQGGALAQTRPTLPPTRDLEVSYRAEGAAAEVVPGGRGDGQVRLMWSTSAQTLRLEADGRPQFLVLNLPKHEAHVIDTGLRSAVLLPVRPRDVDALTLQGATTTRRGEERIAGYGCTVWDVASSRGSGSVCITADGVPLRATGSYDGRQGSFIATSVSLAAQPAERFRVPAGYFSLDLPGLSGLARPR